MRNRTYIMGLGSGLVAGAVLLQLMNVAAHSNSDMLAEDQVRKAAQDIGLKVYDSTQQVYTEQEWKDKTKTEQVAVKPPKSTSTSKPTNPQKAASPANPDSVLQPTASSSASQTASGSINTNTNSSNTSKQVKVKISRGSTLSMVAFSLKEAGVISDASEFIQKAKQRHLTSIIQTGTHSFVKGESFDSISEKLTTK